MSEPAHNDPALRVLLLLGQCPFDPTSGAAQSMRQMATLLAGEGARVRSLSTTGCEGEVAGEPGEWLRASGLCGRVAERRERGVKWIEAEAGGVSCELLCTEVARKHAWERDHGVAYDARLAEVAREFRPQVVLTFGGDASDAGRRARLRAGGARVVFALHNLHYRSRRPEEVDVFLAPTAFLAGRYAEAWGERPAVLPPPVDLATVRAERSEPVCVLFCNPEPAKGAVLVARLAERLGRERPDVPLLVIGGRRPAEDLITIGRDLGFDLARHGNLLRAAPVARVAELWACGRVVLMPSVIEEAAGRMAAEAMVNGVVPLVSDRGGLPEIVGGGGEVIGLPAAMAMGNLREVPEAAVDAWWAALMRSVDDEPWYSAARERALARGAAFGAGRLGTVYREWFWRLK